MRASTELFLWQLTFIAGALYRPNLRHMDESFEGWAYRRGLIRQIQRLEAEAYMERQPGGDADRVYRLTPKGKVAALGGKDPLEHWDRPWDGLWRLLMFDLPQAPQAPRVKLRKVLREHGLGCIQGSVWLSPYPLDVIRKQLKGNRHPSSLLLFEGRTIGGEKPHELVNEAWNFDAINNEWDSLRNHVDMGKPFLQCNTIDRPAFDRWAASEQQAWKKILSLDPLLPSKLLPRGYPGRKIWKSRMHFWQCLSNHLQRTGYRNYTT